MAKYLSEEEYLAKIKTCKPDNKAIFSVNNISGKKFPFFMNFEDVERYMQKNHTLETIFVLSNCWSLYPKKSLEKEKNILDNLSCGAVDSSYPMTKMTIEGMYNIEVINRYLAAKKCLPDLFIENKILWDKIVKKYFNELEPVLAIETKSIFADHLFYDQILDRNISVSFKAGYRILIMHPDHYLYGKKLTIEQEKKILQPLITDDQKTIKLYKGYGGLINGYGPAKEISRKNGKKFFGYFFLYDVYRECRLEIIQQKEIDAFYNIHEKIRYLNSPIEFFDIHFRYYLNFSFNCNDKILQTSFIDPEKYFDIFANNQLFPSEFSFVQKNSIKILSVTNKTDNGLYDADVYLNQDLNITNLKKEPLKNYEDNMYKSTELMLGMFMAFCLIISVVCSLIYFLKKNLFLNLMKKQSSLILEENKNKEVEGFVTNGFVLGSVNIKDDDKNFVLDV